MQSDSDVSSFVGPEENFNHMSQESRITRRDGQIVVIHRKSAYEYHEQVENMLIDEEHKHARIMSYRWLVFNAIFQGICLILITLTIFLFDLIDYDDSNGNDIAMGVIHIQVNGDS